MSDAEAMVGVLADAELYRFTGGEPPTLDELTARYERQVAGPPDGSTATWLNWIVRLDGEPVGYAQATVQNEPGARLAELAWVIGTRWQGRGLASRSAALVKRWLEGQGVGRFLASIHPEHRASERIAERLGLTQLGGVGAGGERTWDTAADTA